MKQGKAIRWKKITALVLSVSMAMSFVPGVVYADTVNEESIVESNSDVTPLSGGNEGGETDTHVHRYEWKAGENPRTITGICSGNGCSDNRTVTCVVRENPNPVYTGSVNEENRCVKIISENGNTLSAEELNGLGIELIYYGNSSSGEGVEPSSSEPVNAGTHCFKVTDKENGNELIKGTFIIDKAKQIVEAVKCQVVMEDYEYGDSVSGPSLRGGDVANACDIKYFYYYDENGNSPVADFGEDFSKLEKGEYYVKAEYGLKDNNNIAYETKLTKFQVTPHTHKYTWTGSQDNPKQISGSCRCKDNRKVTCEVKGNPVYTGSANEEERCVRIISENGNRLSAEELNGLGIELIYYKNSSSGDGEVVIPSEPIDAGTHSYKVIDKENGNELIKGTFIIDKAKQIVEAEKCQVIMEDYEYGDSVSGPSLRGEDVANACDIKYFYYYDENGNSPVADFGKDFSKLEKGEYYVKAEYSLRGDNNIGYETKSTKFQVTSHTHKYTWTGNQDNPKQISGSCRCKDNRKITCEVKGNPVYTGSANEEERCVRIISENGNRLSAEELNGLGIELIYYKNSSSGDGEAAAPSEPVEAGTHYYKVADKGNGNELIKGTFTITRAKDNADRKVIMRDYKQGTNVSEPSLDNLSGIDGEVKYYYYKGEEESPADDLKNVSLNQFPIGTYWVDAEYQLINDPNHYFITAKEKFQVEEHVHEWSYERNETTGTVTATCVGAGICGDKTVKLELKITEPLIYDKEPKAHCVVVLANENDLTLNSGLGIKPELLYKNGAGEVLKEEPKDAGEYSVRVTFDGNDKAFLQKGFKIEEASQKSDLSVNMRSYPYGAEDKVQYPELSGKIEAKVQYHYYQKGGENDPSEFNDDFNSISLNAGEYFVYATYKLTTDENITYETEHTQFEVEKGTFNVIMPDYDLECKQPPSPSLSLNGALSLNEVLSKSAKYYYSTKNQSAGGREWKQNTKLGGRAKEKTYYIYAEFENLPNYEQNVIMQTKKFTVYPAHKGDKMPKSLKSKTQKINTTCIHCQEKLKGTLPKEQVSVVLGNSVKLPHKNCTFKLDKQSKVNKKWEKYLKNKKYFSVKENGEITTKAKPAYYSSMKSPVPVSVTLYGQSYKMKVKIKIPKPAIKITCKKVVHGSDQGYKFTFKYKFPNASKVQVKMKGETENIKNHLKKYVSGSESTSKSTMDLSNRFLKQLNNKAIFKIQVWYGTKKSKKTISVPVNKR